jgi:phosphatidylglycerol:prolipoprotein diacylglycerol transferase
MALAFPQIDPVALRLGPLVVRWYALAYIAGLLGGWWYARWLVRRPPFAMKAIQVDDFLVWATLGVVLGGRLGFVLFYKPAYFLANPAEIIAVWQGGMSFHGGLLGVVLAIVLFCRRHKLSIPAVGDVICCVVPIGLFFGRLANFVNGELYGRAAPEFPYAMIFPKDPDHLPRYPSQLLEAALEGLVLFLVLHLMWRLDSVRMRPGVIIGTFLAGYGLARIVSEFFREPDAYLGYLWAGATMGQLLSIPMVLAGLTIVMVAWRRAR